MKVIKITRENYKETIPSGNMPNSILEQFFKPGINRNTALYYSGDDLRSFFTHGLISATILRTYFDYEETDGWFDISIKQEGLVKLRGILDRAAAQGKVMNRLTQEEFLQKIERSESYCVTMGTNIISEPTLTVTDRDKNVTTWLGPDPMSMTDTEYAIFLFSIWTARRDPAITRRQIREMNTGMRED